MKNLSVVLFVAFALFFGGCKSEEKNQSIALNNIEFSLEGPLYSGSNPAQYTFKVDLKTLLGENYKEGATIKSASLKSAKIRSLDSATSLENINSFVLSFASDNKDIKMKELALLNPVPAGSKSAELKPSATATAEEFFGETQFYIVLDADLKNDIEANLSFAADLVFEVNYK